MEIIVPINQGLLYYVSADTETFDNDDFAEFSFDATYGVEDQVIVSLVSDGVNAGSYGDQEYTPHTIYISTSAVNTENYPPSDDGSNWIFLKTMNQWKVLDGYVNTQTENPGDLEIEVEGSGCDRVAFLNVAGVDEIDIEIIDRGDPVKLFDLAIDISIGEPSGVVYNLLEHLSAVPRYVHFSSDGQKMYIAEFQTSPSVVKAIRQFDLSVPFNPSTADYSNRYFQPPELSSPSFALSTDGSKLYVNLDVISFDEYDLATNFDISTAAFNQSFSVSGNPPAMFFKPDGSVLYYTGSSASTIVYQRTLSTPWDTSTLGAATSKDISANSVTNRGLWLSKDGIVMTVFSAGQSIQQYTLSTPWDVTTAAFTRQITGITGTNYGLAFAGTGDRFFYLASAAAKSRHVCAYAAAITSETAVSVNLVDEQKYRVYFNCATGQDDLPGRIHVSTSTDIGDAYWSFEPEPRRDLRTDDSGAGLKRLSAHNQKDHTSSFIAAGLTHYLIVEGDAGFEVRGVELYPVTDEYQKEVDHIQSGWPTNLKVELETGAAVIQAIDPVSSVSIHCTFKRHAEAALVKVGGIMPGRAIDVGRTLYGQNMGILDYSMYETDDWGRAFLRPGKWAKTMHIPFYVENSEIDAVQRAFASVRGVPVVYNANQSTTNFDSLIIYGWSRNFEPEIRYPDVTFCTVEIRGMI